MRIRLTFRCFSWPLVCTVCERTGTIMHWQQNLTLQQTAGKIRHDVMWEVGIETTGSGWGMYRGGKDIFVSVRTVTASFSDTHTYLCEQASSTADIQYFQSCEWFSRATFGVHVQQIIPEQVGSISNQSPPQAQLSSSYSHTHTITQTQSHSKWIGLREDVWEEQPM